MSDLKYQSVEQLRISKADCERYIKKLSGTLTGQRQQLVWIEQYLFIKTPQELSLDQIEQRLGHKVIIKP